jgi:iron complex transport system ATP-binding protein
VIEVDGVSVAFGDSTVLRDVSLSVEAGSFLALVGPNGAGKTTLLRAVNGLVALTTGSITIDGAAVASLSARELARRVATVPQETHLGFDFDARSIVEMGRTPHRSRLGGSSEGDRDAVERALERTETAALADRPVGDLSGGERQRVLLARALAQETPTLLLDEPTASLDINHQLATLSLVRHLADEGQTAVAAIHDLNLAARFCDRMALLADGELLAVGAPDAVLTSERLADAYGVPTAVTENPVTGTPTVTALEREHAVPAPGLEADDD